MAKKEKPELVNPKWLVRKLYALPLEDIELREMILALWAHSNTFIEASEARRGSVSFTCQASQTQLAAFCHLKTEKSAYSRLVRLNKLGLVEWTTNRSHKANEYYVQLDLTSVVMTTGDTDENPFDVLPLAGEPPVGRSSVVEEASSVVSSLSSVVEASSSVVQATDSGFSGSYDLADTGLRLTETEAERFAETRETLDPKPKPLLATAPKPPAHPAPQAEEIPPPSQSFAWTPPPKPKPLTVKDTFRSNLPELRNTSAQHSWVPSEDGPKCSRCGIYREENKFDPQDCIEEETNG